MCFQNGSAGAFAAVLLAFFSLAWLSFPVVSVAGILLLPDSGLKPNEVGVIVNDSDPLSRQIGDYYVKHRGIPRENLIRVRFPPGKGKLSPKVFRRINTRIEKLGVPGIRAYAIAWAMPYKVGCMSLTMAIATGYDERFCPQKGVIAQCGPGRLSPWFAHAAMPEDGGRFRPAMMLAAIDFDQAKRLIDRGIASDGLHPKGTAYLLSTSEKNRNVRAAGYPEVRQAMLGIVPIQVLQQDELRDRKDVLFYFTGKARVAGLKTLSFLPGAVADHLTSYGGVIKAESDKGQMSSLRWLEAGATGSYGTVSEPCNYLEKFPSPGLLMESYLRGETLMESYWRSVAWPAEGIFIGEPLARPFALDRVAVQGGKARIPKNRLWSGHYRLEQADFPVGPYQVTASVDTSASPGRELVLTGLKKPYSRLVVLQNPLSKGLPVTGRPVVGE